MITGPPSAGKTSVIESLGRRGHAVVAETARHYIQSLPYETREIAADLALQQCIQREISRRQEQRELGLSQVERVYLDRALPDSLAYFSRLGLELESLYRRATRFRYRQVFFLDGLPLAEDGLRFEVQDEAAALAAQILTAYERLGYRPVQVPVFAELAPEEAVERRVEFILAHAGD